MEEPTIVGVAIELRNHESLAMAADAAGGHMLDQIVGLLGRPSRVMAVLRNDATPEFATYADNTLAVLEFDRSLAMIDTAAMEARPPARRFEVYGTHEHLVQETLLRVTGRLR